MIRSDLKTALQALGYGSDTDTQQNEAINAAIRRLVGMKRWPWQVTDTTSATISLGASSVSNLPADLLHIDAVRVLYNNEYYEMEWQPHQEVRKWGSATRNTGRGMPEIWCWTSPAVLLIAPTADQAYATHIEYIKTLAIPTSDSTEIPIPDTYEDIVIWLAAMHIAFRERDWNAYNAAKQHADTGIAEMTASEGIKQRQNSTHIVKSGVWDSGALTGPAGI
jgi:hypothetical protein